MNPVPAHPGDRRLERLVEWSLGDGVLRQQDVGHAVLVLTDTLAAIIGAGVEPEMSRVAVVEDPALTAAAPDVRAAGVTVRLRDGRSLTATEKYPPGGFDRPYPLAAVRAKHRALLQGGVGEESADKVIAWCDDLPASQSVRRLHSLVGGAP